LSPRFAAVKPAAVICPSLEREFNGRPWAGVISASPTVAFCPAAGTEVCGWAAGCGTADSGSGVGTNSGCPSGAADVGSVWAALIDAASPAFCSIGPRLMTFGCVKL
jgi:hypothetical protein